jgi:hypothetical protein
VLGQVLVDPEVGLAVGDRVRVDGLDVREGRAGACDEHKVHVDEVLADDAEVGNGGQSVLAGADTAIHRVLNGDHGGDAASAHDVVEGLPHIVDRTPDLALRLRHLGEGGLREGSGRAEEGIRLGSGRFRHARKPSDNERWMTRDNAAVADS